MPRLPAQQWSRKPRQPKAVWSKRLKLLAPQSSELSWSKGPPRLRHSKENMATLCQNLELQVIWQESRSQADFLSACQAILYTSPLELKSTLATSYHILLGQTPPSPPFVLLQRASPVEEQPISAAPPPTPVPKQSPRPKRWHPSPDPVESMPLGRTTLKATLGEPCSSKWPEIPPWNRVLKLSCAKAFGWALTW